MTIKRKVLLILAAQVLFMLLLPLTVIVAEKDGFGATGLFFLAFFAFYPLLCALIGILCGTAIRKLWWAPAEVALLFPLLFGLAIRELVFDLYFYSAFYLPIGLFSMLAAHLFALRKRKKQ